MREIRTSSTNLIDGRPARLAIEDTSATSTTWAVKPGGRFDFRKKDVEIRSASYAEQGKDAAIAQAQSRKPDIVMARTARSALRLARQGKARPA